MSRPVSYRARWVIPVAGPPLAGGVVTVVGKRIVAVGHAADGPVRDLGDVAILPGLVNAHTHLEFSDLRQPLGTAGMPLPIWIALVIAYREATPTRSIDAVRRGLAESLTAGVTTVGEIATAGYGRGAFTHQGPTTVAFRELIGLARERFEPALEQAHEHLAVEASYQSGLSPHAPYTVHIELLAQIVELALARRVPLAMHLAESPEELELLGAGTGLFVDLLMSRRVWQPAAFRRGGGVLDYLRVLARAPRSLIVHGNYLDDEEIAFAAQNASQMSVIYCPRTHAFFGHTRHPLPALRAAGVHVALGTDGRGSNPDLDLWNEIRFVAEHFAELAPADVLQLGTLAGAQALGLAAECGSLTAGKQADMLVVRCDRPVSDDPHAMLFDSAHHVVAVIRGGQLASGAL